MARYFGIVGAQPQMAVPQGQDRPRHQDSELQGLGGAEGADYGGGVALVGVDFGI
jgi:hypothetical protein